MCREKQSYGADTTNPCRRSGAARHAQVARACFHGGRSLGTGLGTGSRSHRWPTRLPRHQAAPSALADR
eukprot:scaffold19172_cov129-Isochrysis_galbana.AAC.3